MIKEAKNEASNVNIEEDEEECKEYNNSTSSI